MLDKNNSLAFSSGEKGNIYKKSGLLPGKQKQGKGLP